LELNYEDAFALIHWFYYPLVFCDDVFHNLKKNTTHKKTITHAAKKSVASSSEKSNSRGIQKGKEEGQAEATLERL
jgi:hypothetical protein